VSITLGEGRIALDGGLYECKTGGDYLESEAEEGIMTTTVEQEILGLEREYWDSMISKDPKVATKLTAKRSIITGAQGVSTVSSDTIGEMVQTDRWKLKSYEFSDVTASAPTPDLAILAYHVKEELEVEGKPLTLEANDSTVWLRQDGKWVSVLHTESLAGDPFGRDR
jgi:hypothetical protein